MKLTSLSPSLLTQPVVPRADSPSKAVNLLAFTNVLGRDCGGLQGGSLSIVTQYTVVSLTL